MERPLRDRVASNKATILKASQKFWPQKSKIYLLPFLIRSKARVNTIKEPTKTNKFL